MTPDNSRGANAPTDLSIGTDPLTANRYSYVYGDPVNLMDPSGHAPGCPDDYPRIEGECTFEGPSPVAQPAERKK